MILISKDCGKFCAFGIKALVDEVELRIDLEEIIDKTRVELLLRIFKDL